ncbi:MAG: nucleotide exchange factor GrpE [Flavobacteriales bacterium]|nr:nucleotide exchange factor GrpE [Flavobacteriales bacterium]
MVLKNPFRRTEKEKTTMEKETMKNEQARTEPLEQTVDPSVGTDNADSPTGAMDQGSTREAAELDILRTEHQALHEKHLRLFAEFDNFRKRTAKEKLELLQLAGAETLKNILPVMDDMERAIANNANVEDPEAIRKGMELIHQKFINLMAAQGMRVMKAKGEVFDPEVHEAITKAPAPEPALKGKVLEVVENGYTMNDKVIRFAKVVVGE